jgi:FixJ family two-component response regulator
MSDTLDRAAARGVVALVDDDPEIREALGGWLLLCGLEGAPHASAESLLAALLDQGGRLELRVEGVHAAARRLLGAVVDVKLPGRSGVDLARLLRQRAPALPLALVTALSDEEIACYGNPPADVRCLRKPFELDALESALGALFTSRAGEPSGA